MAHSLCWNRNRWLDKVQPGTTVYQQAQELIVFAERKLQEIEN